MCAAVEVCGWMGCTDWTPTWHVYSVFQMQDSSNICVWITVFEISGQFRNKEQKNKVKSKYWILKIL